MFKIIIYLSFYISNYLCINTGWTTHAFIHSFVLVWTCMECCCKKNHIQNCANMTFELLSLTQGGRIIMCLFICSCLLACLPCLYHYPNIQLKYNIQTIIKNNTFCAILPSQVLLLSKSNMQFVSQ